ncbi:testis-expressed protein 2 isoform X3 [Diorhabda sublineata]|uniref:testis-expressed protein 2 isoform X2 n=1 Tax=Diorhabda sublineata TaxID=1163346 RepID=UPI0024E064B9|nr:testis-expressed protein 2 isoform X2 [Diorhabda sublineata]XP_056641763.1 testis-expressed protein 2 isoform X3 [Diorhabda sublineata]
MDLNKSKPVTTSVPQISIKFHANAEQIEELHASEDEAITKSDEKGEKIASTSPSNIGEPDSSPLKYFNKIGKRSTSVDVTTQPLNASPPSDPWRFFSDIKGKITKSVEEKITEIKSRNHEEGSPLHKPKSDTTKTDLKTIGDSKENSSISDSEDLSESSISKTCGIVSTTEGVEMSSDEDTPSLEKDKKDEKFLSVTPSSFKHKFRFFRKNNKEEGTIKTNDLSKIYNINTENKEQTLPEDSEGVESAVDALEETDLKTQTPVKISDEEIVRTVTHKIDNFEVDSENVINIREVTGSEIRERFFDCKDEEKTVFAPTGFVDLRPKAKTDRPLSNYTSLLVLLLSSLLYGIIQYYSPYTAGLAAGIILSFVIFKIYLKIHPKLIEQHKHEESTRLNKIFEVQAVKEHQPLKKYEGWLNEYPDVYNPETYHIFGTQSVFLRLQGNMLRISHAKNKVPKRAMWNEPEIKANFTQHRVYNLLGAKISLLPEGLTRIRQWSKKYPICISLPNEQLCFDQELLSKIEGEVQKQVESDNVGLTDKGKVFTSSGREKKGFNKTRKKDYQYPVLAQRFSKLTEGEDLDLDSDSRASTPSADISDIADSPVLEDDESGQKEDKNQVEKCNGVQDDWSPITGVEDSNDSNYIKLYLFGRTDREKEDWYRRLSAATHNNKNLETELDESDPKDGTDNIEEELEYLRYMSTFKPSRSTGHNKPTDKCDSEEEESKEDTLLWLNALIGRVLFDCGRNNHFIDRVKDRIQRKLSTIKLPYFIEELLIPELSLGKTSPIIKRTGKPVMDERGIWIDLDIIYEGLVVLILQTKLNLMRLKNPQAYDKPNVVKSAIYHSDVDDSAESSTDDEGLNELPNTPQDIPAGSSHGKKNLMKMVDRLAESKFFQAATENRYIKKAMEGVSNTHLRLKVEVKSLVGTLVLNIPPPPTDRIWIGFRPVPDLSLSARPIVGERNISYIMVTSWIEKKLVQEFQKVLVIPNMEDLVIPVMNPKLPY